MLDIERLELPKVLELLKARCSNSKTKELAENLKPLTDYEDVYDELNRTQNALDLSIRFGSPIFYDFSDITRISILAKSGSRISTLDLLCVAKLLKQVSDLLSWFSQFENEENPLKYKFSSLMPNSYLKSKIDNAIISENEISDNASPALASLRKKKFRAEKSLRESLEKIVKSKSKYLQDEIVTIRDGRYVIPVKEEFRGEVHGLIHDTSKATYFIEPISVVEANNEIRLLESMESEEIDRILSELSADCGEFADNLIEDFNICVILNLYFAKAKLAEVMGGFMPKISRDGRLNLIKARHPLLFKKAVPIDISVGGDYNTLLITGSNMGGKTVALKTAGLLTLMTMCGLLIPADQNSEVRIFENIFADIGDSQNIEQNLSTFSSHILNVCYILENSNDKSLVLMDELGSGTDPVEGAALAQAIVNRLKNLGAYTIITSHYQEMKLYALEPQNNVMNASFEFNLDNLTPTYKLVTGSPGQSYAFIISRSLGISEEIIADAQSLLTNEEKRLDTIINRLETMRKEYEKNNAELLRLKNEAENAARMAQEELKTIIQKRDSEISDAQKKANNMLDSLKAKSNDLLLQLENLKKEKDKDNFAGKVSDAERLVANTISSLEPKKEDNNDYKLPRDLKIGDEVFVSEVNKDGVVVSDTSNGKVFVQIGNMRIKAQIDTLRLLPPKPKTQEKKKKAIHSYNRTANTELDIRGRDAREGVHEMDLFINNAILAGKQSVCIIHGRGTGILRSACHKRLKEIKAVKSFRLGIYGEGEDGVTIVTLDV